MFFTNRYNKMIIRINDTTDHRGVVLTGEDRMMIMGRPAARIGDKVWCPRCQGEFEIIEAEETIQSFGRAIAFEGHRTSCGARLISSLGGRGNTGIDITNGVLTANAGNRNYQANALSGSTGVNISDIKIYRSPEFRPHNPTDEIVLVMINRNGEGHAGFMIGQGSEAILYDPAGSYTGCPDSGCDNGDPTRRGSLDSFSASFFNWDDYLAYHRADGPKIDVYEFTVSESQGQSIRDNIMRFGGVDPPFCAERVTYVLKESGGVFSELDPPVWIRTPWELGRQLRNILQPPSIFIQPAY